MRSLSIPASDIEYCGMTCFGASDPYVDLLNPKTGTSIMNYACWKTKNRGKVTSRPRA